MRRLLITLALCLACSAPARAQPVLTLTWRPDHLQVDYGAGQSVCVWLVGGGLEDTRVGGPCLPSDQLRLPYAGVDHKHTPLGRKFVELRSANGLVARLSLTPPSRVWVPLVVKEQGVRYEVRLVLVVN